MIGYDKFLPFRFKEQITDLTKRKRRMNMNNIHFCDKYLNIPKKLVDMGVLNKVPKEFDLITSIVPIISSVVLSVLS